MKYGRKSVPGRFAQFISPDCFLPEVQFAKGYVAQCMFRQSINRPAGIIYLRIREVRFKCIKRQSICQITHKRKKHRCLTHSITCFGKKAVVINHKKPAITSSCYKLHDFPCRSNLTLFHRL